MQYLVYDSIAQSYMFYQVQLNNYLVFMLAKVSESLIPTTITFSILLMLTVKNGSEKAKTFSIVSVVLLGILGFFQPIMPNILGFWIMLILIYGSIIFSIFEADALFNLQDATNQSFHKSEKSDGQISR